MQYANNEVTEIDKKGANSNQKDITETAPGTRLLFQKGAGTYSETWTRR
jgi:hypothetical protein